MSKPSFQATYDDGSDATSDLFSFARFIGLESAASGRYSSLLLLQLFCGARSGMLNPAKIVSQIRFLEGIEDKSGLKAATPFKHPPFQGLWHQHYLEDGLQSMANNIQKGLCRFGSPWFKERITEAETADELRYFTVSDVPQLVNDVVNSNWDRLKAQSALTGEWIVFAKHEEKNYYLCLGEHNGDHLLLRSKLTQLVCKSFRSWRASLMLSGREHR